MRNRVYTGRNKELIYALNEDIESARTVKIIVSFIMESGVKLIEESIRSSLQRGAKVQILTGTYLGITEPAALYRLKGLLEEKGFTKDNVEIRLFKGNNSFHPKGYFIEGEHGRRVYVGSSNISQMGLVKGLEWNYIIEDKYDYESVDRFEASFDKIFQEEAMVLDMEFLRSYSANWRKASYGKAVDSNDIHDTTAIKEYEPRGIQMEALYELEMSRKEGMNKGMVISATGSGKTFISAFDTKQFGASKVLYIAHREEILKQAKKSFQHVHPDKKMVVFNGHSKSFDADYIFASVQTLSRDEYLNHLYFKPEQFEYMIVDEFHHAAADSYRKILGYFKPQFLLGLTATPYRMDNQDILSLCENNIIYELNLHTAINRDVLCPYRYLGVYDVVDYSGLQLVNGKYAVNDLEKIYRLHERTEEVYNKYRDYAGDYTIGFCASIKHADEMATYFKKKGIRAEAIHSQMKDDTYDREKLVEEFKAKKISVLFAVDIFNEGVDIPEIDTVMFLRPTESYVVFLQQLGRGLRKHKDKKNLTVIDFIGNYKRAHYKPLLLAGENPMQVERKMLNLDQLQYPEGCHVMFDFRVVDLFREMRKSDPLKERLKDEFYRLKNELGRRPKREDLYEGSDIDHKEFMKKGYLNYLHSLQELDEAEERWIGTEVENFLIKMETTAMSRSYKLPVLLALINNEGIVSYEKIGKSFMSFYSMSKRRSLDLGQDKGNIGWEAWTEEKYLKKALDMPVKFLSDKLIVHDRENQVIRFPEYIMETLNNELKSHISDIINMREKQYYARNYLKRE